MLEARDVRMGQYGHSNQPSHHITYMSTCRTAVKTQEEGREVLSRLYTGSEIGQGYPGARTTARDVVVVPLKHARVLPVAVALTDVRDRFAAVHQGDGPAGRGKKLVISALRTLRIST